MRILNDPVALGMQIEQAGSHPDVVLEATCGWYWAVDMLQVAGAEVHLVHPLGVKGFGYRRVKSDVRDAVDLAELLRMGRLPKSWIAPKEVRELRDLVRYRATLVALRSGLKAQVHAVLAKQAVTAKPRPASVRPPVSPANSESDVCAATRRWGGCPRTV
ncbi:transposase [Streptomyces viridochromogenes DSM 40736]|uniref:Transposase n=1 Tax=Streptomyces viridochromogenes (strain DSM 40736 / JCM 4977 / BCRC 1201 / Tue 494) TaxID=591159 RepID=D9X335_STRVT|nr:IS110 family transposase [Streptomyces viridochromogenes]EFL29551.1 transposase [Streptomyces viridochromogenes DSM 40736]